MIFSRKLQVFLYNPFGFLGVPVGSLIFRINSNLFQENIQDFLIEINNNGTTIILTTHYLEEAEKLCKNISIIDKGEIVKTSSMQSLLRELDTEIFIFDLKNQIDPKSISNSPFDIKILDTYQISVEINKSQSLNEIFRYLNENNLNILSMRNETNRLEELFLDLTEK